ncbi:ABC transporter permease [Pseudochryseolinea flava]|uniref:ABC transporter permease n=1 Tax=Pseudochryseolinea flava TaxID=2059302 RepID=A0A364Y6C5_9BACT|nr:ABC transporter permease [Pseudochryseolinea flava]RAW02611.1 ABC transporter permease [Pseudochryseolinea flava]
MNKINSMILPLLNQVKYSLTNPGRDHSSRSNHPFWLIVRKEVSDHIRSWRFIILLILIVLTCIGSLYTALKNLPDAMAGAQDDTFLFLKLFTVTDGSLPSFVVFVGFLGPLLGISLGFDAINSEQNNNTLVRLMAQPIHRDYVINAKFTAALTVISIMLFSLCILMTGLGLIRIGIPPSAEEFWRIIFFGFITICYVAFWLNLSILFSIRFKQPSTSALSAIAVWIFFSVFYPLIVKVIAKAMEPSALASPDQIINYQGFVNNLLRLIPSQLFSDATTTLMMPSVRTLGLLRMEQLVGTVPGSLPLGQSLLLAWPQLTGLIGTTMLCFGLSYYSFMRREIRS